MDAQEECTKKSGHIYVQCIFAMLANFTFLIYGMESGWISPITSLLQSDASPAGYPLSSNELSWTASVLGVTATIGVLSYSHIADRYGRKIGVLIVALLEVISWTIRLSYTSLALLILARAIAGFAAGGCFNIIPMYVKEISQENITGILGTFQMLMHTTGIFLMYVMGAYLDYTTVIIIVTGLSIVTLVALTKAPESPAFLVKQDRIEHALETVAFLRGLHKDDAIVQKLVDDMIKQENNFKLLPNITFINILKNKSWRRGFIIIILLFTCYEINGAFVIVTFATKILASTGIRFDISPEIQSFSFPVVMILASLALTFCVEKCGRKPILIATYSLSALAMFALALMILAQKQYGNVPAWMPLIALIVAVAMYSSGVSPLSFIIMTEMFNFQIRAKVVGVVVTYAWFLTFVAQSTYTPIAESMGDFAPFVFYGFVNLVSVVFVILFLIETRGKTEEEIYRKDKRKSIELNPI